MAAMTDGMENALIDFLFRGQAFVPPTTWYFGLLTANPTDSTAGTEATGGAYARVAVVSSLANWAGTQAAASTVASSGASGTTSNNAAVTFPAPTANWGSITGMGLYDAASAGNLRFYSALTVAKTVNNGDPAPAFAISSFTLQIDN